LIPTISKYFVHSIPAQEVLKKNENCNLKKKFNLPKANESSGRDRRGDKKLIPKLALFKVPEIFCGMLQAVGEKAEC
jgi:hypothetical protein